MSSEKYYVLSENFCLDSNQWSILIGAIGVLLTLFGFIIAFVIYQKQRNDNAQDAFNYFQSSLPELKKAIEGTKSRFCLKNIFIFFLPIKLMSTIYNLQNEK